MPEEEILQKAIMLKQQSEEVEKHLQFVNEQIKDLEEFSENLKTLEGSEEKEFLASIGRGVHVKSERKEDEKLFVEVGAGVLVRKTPGEAREVIQGQVKKFNEARLQLKGQLEDFAGKFQEMLEEVEKIKDKK